MRWVDYSIDQVGTDFRVEGEWFGEVWQNRQGEPKANPLYKPGDVFIVNDQGWLVKQEELTTMLIQYEAKKE